MENFDMELFVRALGLSFVLEGILWAGLPGLVKRACEELAKRNEAYVRAGGIVSLLLGIGICLLVPL